MEVLKALEEVGPRVKKALTVRNDVSDASIIIELLHGYPESY